MTLNFKCPVSLATEPFLTKHIEARKHFKGTLENTEINDLRSFQTLASEKVMNFKFEIQFPFECFQVTVYRALTGDRH